jgi:hypothetical protein
MRACTKEGLRGLVAEKLGVDCLVVERWLHLVVVHERLPDDQTSVDWSGVKEWLPAGIAVTPFSVEELLNAEKELFDLKVARARDDARNNRLWAANMLFLLVNVIAFGIFVRGSL